MVQFEGVETDNIFVALWEDVLEYGSFNGFGANRPSITDGFADDELASASASHEVDDTFAVDANLLDEFVMAAFGAGMISGVAFIWEVYQCGRA